jgi:hypothetical protein
MSQTDIIRGIQEAAQALGISAHDLATIISYETGGTLDPMKRGPTTKWGQHRGLIQFGEPQAKRHGVDFSSRESAISSQLGANGAIVKYFKAHGAKPGMGLMDLYSIVNAGAPGRFNASDANNGGAPGTVADKVNDQMAGHQRRAARLLGDSDTQYASNTSANPDNTIDFDSMVRSAPQYRTVYNGEDPTGQEGYALSGTGRTTEYASDPRQITANEDQSGQEGYSLSGAGRVENPPLDYLKERQSRLYPPFGGDPNRPLPGRGAPSPPSGPPTFQQQAQSFDPNSIDQNAWINPHHGRMMAYNHAMQTGNTRVADALANPSTMQTRLNPTGIAHGFSRTVLDVASGEIDAMREEEEHKKSSAQGAASFIGNFFR